MDTVNDTKYRECSTPPPAPADLIRAAISERGLNPASFGREFGEGLGTTIPRQTIHNWVDGSFAPSRRLMFLAVQVYPTGDWRGELARSVLALYDAATKAHEGGEND